MLASGTSSSSASEPMRLPLSWPLQWENLMSQSDDMQSYRGKFRPRDFLPAQGTNELTVTMQKLLAIVHPRVSRRVWMYHLDKMSLLLTYKGTLGPQAIFGDFRATPRPVWN